MVYYGTEQSGHHFSEKALDVNHVTVQASDWLLRMPVDWLLQNLPLFGGVLDGQIQSLLV